MKSGRSATARNWRKSFNSLAVIEPFANRTATWKSRVAFFYNLPASYFPGIDSCKEEIGRLILNSHTLSPIEFNIKLRKIIPSSHAASTMTVGL